MKYIFTFALIILLSGISYAEAIPFAPQPIPKPTSPIKVDEYGEISFKEEKERLKPAVEEMKNDQNQFGDMYLAIIYYGEKCSTTKRINNVKNYLIKEQGIESNKISTTYGGLGETKTEIYLFPVKPSADNPNIDSKKNRTVV